MPFVDFCPRNTTIIGRWQLCGDSTAAPWRPVVQPMAEKHHATAKNDEDDAEPRAAEHTGKFETGDIWGFYT